MKRPIFIIASLSFIIIALSVVRVTFVNDISTTGIELVHLQNEINAYKKQNNLLKEQYLQASSFTNIEDKAEALGFVPAKAHVYLSTPLPLARR